MVDYKRAEGRVERVIGQLESMILDLKNLKVPITERVNEAQITLDNVDSLLLDLQMDLDID